MPQVITLYKCARCGEKTEWEFILGSKPLCKHCWDGRAGRPVTSGWARRKRNKEIIRLFTLEGKSVEELVPMFGVSLRTIGRILKSQVPEVKV